MDKNSYAISTSKLAQTPSLDKTFQEEDTPQNFSMNEKELVGLLENNSGEIFDPYAKVTPTVPATNPEVDENIRTSLSLPHLATLKNFSPEEIQKVRDRRQELIVKELANNISEAEEKEIEYLDWQLDRFEISRDKEIFDEEDELITKNKMLVEAMLRQFGLNV